jgi:hypothetical protein
VGGRQVQRRLAGQRVQTGKQLFLQLEKPTFSSIGPKTSLHPPASSLALPSLQLSVSHECDVASTTVWRMLAGTRRQSDQPPRLHGSGSLQPLRARGWCLCSVSALCLQNPLLLSLYVRVVCVRECRGVAPSHALCPRLSTCTGCQHAKQGDTQGCTTVLPGSGRL